MTTTLAGHVEVFQSFRLIRCTCGWSADVGPESYRKAEAHRAHLAAVLAATVTEAQAGALREAADDLNQQFHLLAFDFYRDWLRARADSLVDRAEQGQG